MAAAMGLVSKPEPGTLSNAAASTAPAVYGVGRASSGGSAASIFSFSRSASVQRLGRRDHAHPHRHRQRPAGGVVRLFGRAAVELAKIGILLRIEDLARQRDEFLVGGNHPGAGRKRFAFGADRCGQLRDPDAGEGEPPQQLDRGRPCRADPAARSRRTAPRGDASRSATCPIDSGSSGRFP